MCYGRKGLGRWKYGLWSGSWNKITVQKKKKGSLLEKKTYLKKSVKDVRLGASYKRFNSQTKCVVFFKNIAIQVLSSLCRLYLGFPALTQATITARHR